MNRDDLDATARTVLGEARGEDWTGQLAVAHVVANRARLGGWWGDCPAAVCRMPRQFSCWNPDDPNLALIEAATLAGNAELRAGLAAAAAALAGLAADPTRGATHYHASSLAPPRWTRGARVLARLGGHIFYGGVA